MRREREMEGDEECKPPPLQLNIPVMCESSYDSVFQNSRGHILKCKRVRNTVPPVTLWYRQGLTTNGWEILIWHMSLVFCKYAEYFPPTVSENSCLLSQCRHRGKFFKVSRPRRESRKILSDFIASANAFGIYRPKLCWWGEKCCFERIYQTSDSGYMSRRPFLHAGSVSGFLTPCCSRCCSGRQRWALRWGQWGGWQGSIRAQKDTASLGQKLRRVSAGYSCNKQLAIFCFLLPFFPLLILWLLTFTL